MKLEYEVVALKTRHPSHTARRPQGRRAGVWVGLTDSEGLSGRGEVDPVPYLGETADTGCAALDAVALLSNDPFAGLDVSLGRVRLTSAPGLGVCRA